MKKVGIVSCYFQHNYGSMLQAFATQMALDKLNIENETINISGFDEEIKRAKLLYFAKAALTSDILLSKMGMAKNVLVKKILKNQYASFSKQRFSAKNILDSLLCILLKQNLALNVKTLIQQY